MTAMIRKLNRRHRRTKRQIVRLHEQVKGLVGNLPLLVALQSNVDSPGAATNTVTGGAAPKRSSLFAACAGLMTIGYTALPGAKVGHTVWAVTDLSTGFDGQLFFEPIISVAGMIKQVDAGPHLGIEFLVILTPPS